ncbi:MAG: MBL fold metallo-hydrolase [Sphingomonadales bacterium]|nr:MBL fold metallo-hydrolase [Sphingomonadales bacterium]
MSRYYSGPPSDHFDGERFFGPQKSGGKGLGSLLKWQLGSKRAKWPRWIENAPQPPPPERVEGNAIQLTMIGHVSVLIQTAGINILTDPVWSDRASPFQVAGPKRVRAPGITLDALPPIDLILVSHNHYDHLDTTTLDRLVHRFDPEIVTPLGNGTIIRKATPNARIVEIDWDDTTAHGPLTIEAEPVNHWSARWSTDRNEALWAGMTIHAPARRIFFNGDSGYAGGWWVHRLMQKHGTIDVSLCPIGAYEPRWFMKDAHMDPDEAVEVYKTMNGPMTLGFHWGVFQLTDEPINEPKERLMAALAREGIDPARFRTLEPGESWTVTDVALNL